VSEEANKATLNRLFDEIVNQGRFELIDELYDPGMIDHDPVPGAPPGLAAVEHTLRALRTGFPDLQVTLDDVVAEGDKVALRGTWRGTNSGWMLGMAPTGKRAEWRGMVIFRFLDNGKVAERWGLMDTTSLLQQVGLIPQQGTGPLGMLRFMAARAAGTVRARRRAAA
jgi:predicted ester cyclase